MPYNHGVLYNLGDVLQTYAIIVDRSFRLAVARDHADEHSDSCGNTCDIVAALRAGYPRVAAYLLNGATETPTVDRVMERYGETFDAFGHRDATDPDWLAWIDWFRENTVHCPWCEASCFTDKGTVYTCGNCRHDVSQDSDDDDDDS